MAFEFQRFQIFSSLLLVTACASGGSGANNDATGGGGTSAGGAHAGGSANATSAGGAPMVVGGGGSPGVGGGIGVGAGGGGVQGAPLVYVHSNTTLFTFDPAVMPYNLQTVGDFDCIGGSGQDTAMTDFAVDSTGNLFGVSSAHAYVFEIKGNVVHCKSVISLPAMLPSGKAVKFYALSIAPPGVITDGKEVPIAGNTEGELWAISDTGQLSLHGNFGTVPKKDQNGYQFPNAGQPWELSGDIVFLQNGSSPIGFATVRDCPKPPSSSGCNTDSLIEIDVPALKTATTNSVLKAVRGKITKAATCNDASSGSYGSMFGIAAFNDQIFGFSNKGEFVSISNKDGSACLVQSFMDKWAGAGVTTLAPVVPPPPVPM